MTERTAQRARGPSGGMACQRPVRLPGTKPGLSPAPSLTMLAGSLGEVPELGHVFWGNPHPVPCWLGGRSIQLFLVPLGSMANISAPRSDRVQRAAIWVPDEEEEGAALS